MIDVKKLRTVVIKGLKEYLGVPVIRNNQTANAPPYPYVSFTITTLSTEYNGTWGEYADGVDRKPTTQIWSITAQSNNNDESVSLANKARDWLDRVGRTYLKDNNVTVQKVMNITNRDNILTVEYEYKNGFDVVFALFEEIQNPVEQTGYIENIEFNN